MQHVWYPGFVHVHVQMLCAVSVHVISTAFVHCCILIAPLCTCLSHQPISLHPLTQLTPIFVSFECPCFVFTAYVLICLDEFQLSVPYSLRIHVRTSCNHLLVTHISLIICHLLPLLLISQLDMESEDTIDAMVEQSGGAF